MLKSKSAILFANDLILIALAFALSFMFRFDFHLPSAYRDTFWEVFCLVFLIKTAVLLGTGFYRNLWRYASLHDALHILKSVSIASVAVALVFLFIGTSLPFPRSIILLDWALLFFLISSSRVIWRFYREMTLKPHKKTGRNTLIVGAGESGSLLLKEIRRHSSSPYKIVGFVDDDNAKQGMFLHGVGVLGNLARLREIVEAKGVEEIIIAIPSAKGKALLKIVEQCKTTGVRFRSVPAMRDILNGNLSISQIKNVDIGDLLGRESVVLDEAGIRNYLTGKRVLVTGAAGSIGSELCRQLARFEPGCLIILDSAETPLFYIERELQGKFPGQKLVPVLGDIRNREKVTAVFEEYLPQVVFHAAAYKHVPMMEYNQVEAVTNNIGGTRIMADAAHRFGVENFVMISSDKAVNPTNVMGASKRVAEIYVQALSRKSLTRFSTVRFGNVLGSNGSVIPLFMEQIKNGGPVTVTDPDVVRYFMTIPEAAQLVLQAGGLGKGGEIFVLDMGEPVRIKDLAEELIRLSGFVPYEDIDIVFTGLRPGEKLFEELLIDGEGIMRTTHEKIRVAASVKMELSVVNAGLNHLFALADNFDVTGIMHSLCTLVAEFTPSRMHDLPVPRKLHPSRAEHMLQKKIAAESAKVIPIRGGGAAQSLFDMGSG
jgi:FlaA1/EpsC-like NDP-sugar epimerase